MVTRKSKDIERVVFDKYVLSFYAGFLQGFSFGVNMGLEILRIKICYKPCCLCGSFELRLMLSFSFHCITSSVLWQVQVLLLNSSRVSPERVSPLFIHILTSLVWGCKICRTEEITSSQSSCCSSVQIII